MHSQEQCKESFACKLLTRVGHHKRVGARVAVMLLAIDWDLPLGNWAWMHWHPAWGLALVTAPSKSEGRTSWSFVSCVCSPEETSRHGKNCIWSEDTGGWWVSFLQWCWLERVLRGCWGRDWSEGTWTERKSGKHVSICGCWPCWWCCNSLFTHRCHIVCLQCTNCLVQQAAEHGGVSNIWQWVCCIADLWGVDCCFVTWASEFWQHQLKVRQMCFVTTEAWSRMRACQSLPLLKKHNVINCHAAWEAAAAGISWVRKEDGQTNLADSLAKVVTGQKWWDSCWCLFWWIVDWHVVPLAGACACGLYPCMLPPELALPVANQVHFCLLQRRMFPWRKLSWLAVMHQLTGTKWIGMWQWHQAWLEDSTCMEEMSSFGRSNSDRHNLCSVRICNDASHACCQTCHCHNEVSASWFIHLQLAVLSFFAVLSQPFSVLSLSQQFAVLRVWFSVLAWFHNLLCSDSASCLLCFASNLLFSAGNSLCWDWLIQQFSVLWQFSVLRWQFSVLSLQLAVLSISAVMSQQFSVLSLSQQLAVLRACFSVLILISQFAALRLSQLSVVLCQQLAVLSWEFSVLRLIDPAVFCAETTFFCAEMTIFCAEPATCCAELFCCAEPAVFCTESEPTVCCAENVVCFA